MSSLARSEKKACNICSSVANDSAIRGVAIDELMTELAPLEKPRTALAVKPQSLSSSSKTPVREATPVGCQPAPRSWQRVPTVESPDWFNRLLLALCFGFTLFSGVIYYRSLPRSPGYAPASVLSSAASRQKSLRIKPIGQVRVGERAVGRNPIREQAELSEPDPATWRHISLFMKKRSGLGLWINLLRPQSWLEEHQATVGSTIFINLAEMGAVGEAEVTEIGPCPTIAPGTGPVVTGTFQHQADARTRLVRLVLEDQPEATSVTDNHPYWSVDRQDFIPVGQLRIGEQVDTEQGPKRVVSITPAPYSGFLYNLETTEHVFRVGSLGTLVHNSCATLPYGGPGGGHHIFAKRAFEGVKGYDPNKALAIPQSEISRLGLNHLDADGITQTQRRLFTELAESGRPNSLSEHARIAKESLIAGGLSTEDAASVVAKALEQIESWGINAPSRIPWN